QILFGNVLLTTRSTDHYHCFTIGTDVSILVLRTFPGNTLRCSAVDIHFINLWTTCLVRRKGQILAVREPGWLSVVATTIRDLTDLTRTNIHHVQVQATGFRQGKRQFGTVRRERRRTVVTRE